MKKVRITLKEGSTGRKFYLFPSPEALYVWACALEKDEQVIISDIHEIVLEPGGFIEAELTGFEYAYEDMKSTKHKRLDRIRLGLAMQPKNAAGLEVSTHVGWVTGTLLPMKRYSDPHIDIIPIEAEDAKIDLPALFNDDIPITIED
jgi:hypothetical protein